MSNKTENNVTSETSTEVSDGVSIGLLTKVCSKCGVEKEVGLFKKRFYVGKKGIVGYGYCKACHNSISKEYYHRNKEKKLEYQKKLNKEKIVERREGKRKDAKRYNKSKQEASPPWLTTQQRKQMNDAIRERNRLRKETGLNYTVDHIIPFNSKYVCGLHVPWNVCVMLNEENASKHASIDNDLLKSLYTNYQPFEETPELIYMVEKYKMEEGE